MTRIVWSMTNAETIAARLSAEAQSSLIGAGTNRQAAACAAHDHVVISELKAHGLIGDGNGLTRLGTIVRQIVVTKRENEMFG